MSKNNFTFIPAEGAQRFPIKAWDHGVDFADNTIQQLRNIASLPFVHHHVAAMPDAHLGIGATVGSVIATKGAVVPAAVGVDIGCGMMAWKTTLKGAQLPDSLGHVRAKMEHAVPHGRTDNGGMNDRGTFSTDGVSQENVNRWELLEQSYLRILDKHPKLKAHKTAEFIGTLGTGNHFIELCLDESDNVWIMLHSGSRGVGNKIGTYFIEQAKREMERYFVTPYLADKDCAYLVEHSELFDDYVNAVGWAQDFALMNREAMMEQTISALLTVLPPFAITDTAINCHHNYISREHHFGSNVIVTRKGAVRAREGDMGIIPGSMGTGSFIVRGLGNPESFCSCSHGAGRKMSRGQAFKCISVDDHVKATEGVECRKDEGVLDESPAAYKDLGAVMAAQSDLVEIVTRLKTIVNVKG